MNTYIVLHFYKNGVTPYCINTNIPIDLGKVTEYIKQKIVEKCEIEFEEDKGEYLEFFERDIALRVKL